jgi:hypothetical protein
MPIGLQGLLQGQFYLYQRRNILWFGTRMNRCIWEILEAGMWKLRFGRLGFDSRHWQEFLPLHCTGCMAHRSSYKNGTGWFFFRDVKLHNHLLHVPRPRMVEPLLHSSILLHCLMLSYLYKKTPWPESSSERRLLAKLVPTFADRVVPRSQRGGSPTAVILGF